MGGEGVCGGVFPDVLHAPSPPNPLPPPSPSPPLTIMPSRARTAQPPTLLRRAVCRHDGVMAAAPLPPPNPILPSARLSADMPPPPCLPSPPTYLMPPRPPAPPYSFPLPLPDSPPCDLDP